MGIVFSPQSLADLDDVWLYIAKDSVNEADKFIDKIYEKCLLFSESPQIGRERNDIAKGLRSFPVGDYVILYRIINGDIEIARVFHGKRDYQNLF